MAEHNQELLAALAQSDLEPFMASMSFGEKIPVFISLKKLAPCKWGSWVHEKLLMSENAAYWRGQLKAPCDSAEAGVPASAGAGVPASAGAGVPASAGAGADASTGAGPGAGL